MQVELDMFSGRPNPQWSLTSQEAVEFNRLIQQLPEAEVESFARPGLGYLGLIVSGAEDSVGGYSEVVVFAEQVVGNGGTDTLRFIDKGRTLERWLLQTGKNDLEANLYLQVLSELDQE